MHSGALRPMSVLSVPARRSLPAIGAAHAMVLPAAILLLTMIVLPLVAVLLASLTDWKMGSSRYAFVGLDNYVHLAGDTQFRRSVGITLTYVLVGAPVSVLAGLVVALLISSTRRFQSFYRTVYFLPTIATLAAAVIAWQILLHPNSGLVNHMLGKVGVEGPNWLKDPTWTLWTLVVIGIWERLGFNTIFFLAAMEGTPRDLLDAARMEGASSPLERFWLVVRPHLAPITLFLTVIGCIHAFQAFEAVAILTQGGPQKSTQLLIYTIYQEGFVFFRTNYAAAATVVFVIILMTLSALQFRQTGRRGGGV